MTSISPGSPAVEAGSRPWFERIRVPEMWASLAIAAMWLAVLFAAIFGPDFVSTSAGGNATRIPSVILVALFAYLGTRAVAKAGFGRSRGGGDGGG